MEEIWKDVLEYEGLYQVSNFGRVMGLPRIIDKKNGTKALIKGKILIPQIRGLGYLSVVLSKYNITKPKYIHQLVAIAFLGHKANGMHLVIDHINDDKSDNRVENLQIVTQRYNVFKTQGNYTSKFKGVHRIVRNNSFRAQITINKKVYNLGTFKNEYDAYLAYQNALKNLEQ